jgi:hypothetical protein
MIDCARTRKWHAATQGKRQREGGTAGAVNGTEWHTPGGRRQPLVSGYPRAVMQAYPTMLGRRMGARGRV